MISDDEYLERIVAGIQDVTTDGADVTWNETINGRQFDVVVRFKLGTLSYLVVVEVRNKTRRTGVNEIEAFITKARDQKANKTVFVNVAGFQSGAVEVAQRHGVELFKVSFDEKWLAVSKNANFVNIKMRDAEPSEQPTLNIGEANLVNVVEKATLIYDDGSEAEMPTEPSQMTYYAHQTKLADGRTLHEAIFGDAPHVVLGENLNAANVIDPPQRIEPPDDLAFPAGTVRLIRYRILGRMGRPIRGNIKIEPTSFSQEVIYTNVITDEVMRFNIGSLPLGVKRVQPGSFYFNYFPLRYYYCESIKRNKATYHLIESFQSGELFRATGLVQDVKYSYYYIPVSDKPTLNRLQTRLELLLNLEAKKS
jgi:hypothetical protein